MKQNIKDYLWNNTLMEFSLLMLWSFILKVDIKNDFIIWWDLNTFIGVTVLGTIVWVIGLIHEVRK